MKILLFLYHRNQEIVYNSHCGWYFYFKCEKMFTWCQSFFIRRSSDNSIDIPWTDVWQWVYGVIWNVNYYGLSCRQEKIKQRESYIFIWKKDRNEKSTDSMSKKKSEASTTICVCLETQQIIVCAHKNSNHQKKGNNWNVADWCETHEHQVSEEHIWNSLLLSASSNYLCASCTFPTYIIITA